MAAIKPPVTLSDLEKIDMRVGEILSVEDVMGSDKLVKPPKEIEGKQALFVVNLESKKMVGEMSEGMLFDIGYADGITPVLAIPEVPVPNGMRAG